MDVEKTIEFILQQQANAEVQMQKIREAQIANERETARTNAVLRRAIRLAVQEARNERKRRQDMDRKFDEKMTQLASAQLMNEQAIQRTQEQLDGFIREMRSGGRNGQGES